MKMKSILVSVLLCVSFVFLSSCQKGSEGKKDNNADERRLQADVLFKLIEKDYLLEIMSIRDEEALYNIPFYKFWGINEAIKRDSTKNDPTNKVYTLKWSYRRALNREITPEISKLKDLRYFAMTNDSLNGKIPKTLGDLPDLEYIRLDQNDLCGEIPKELGKLAKLKTLSLELNDLEGMIPEELSQLKELEWLNLGYNRLEGTFPRFLQNNKKLIFISLRNNRLSGTLPFEVINQIKDLKVLDVSWNKFEGELPEDMGDYDLYLDSNRFAGPIPKAVVKRKGDLSLKYNMLWSDDPEVIAFLDAKCKGWQTTQTIPPKGVRVEKVTDDSVKVSWEPILFQEKQGYYVIHYGTEPGNYTEEARTQSKKDSELIIEGLTPGKAYYFAVRSFTALHVYNQNELLSEFSKEVRIDL